MAKKRITPEELNEKLADISIPERELAEYFVIDEMRSGAFKPALELNPETVKLPDNPGEAKKRSEAAMTFANDLSRLRRTMRFNCMIGAGYDGPIIVSEGDSWFQYPIMLEDTIDHLLDAGLAVRSLGAAGDTLENMIREREYIDAIEETGASIFLLSAGGNDALGGGNLKAHLRDFDPALTPEAHLLPSFDGLLDHALAMYEQVLRDVVTRTAVTTLCHGYDYAIPDSGKWLGKPMEARGITDNVVQRAIVVAMINRFNTRQKTLIGTFGGRVVHVDVRGVVGNSLNNWHDELHPKDPGYGRVAEQYKASIANISASAGRGTAKRTGKRAVGVKGKKTAQPAARIGLSLHIGLNRIDPAHYGSDAPLAGCHFDAEDMARIAATRDFEPPETLLDEAATRGMVIARIEAAAERLKAGDMFLLTYAGHGSQVPDFNRDERDGSDETLCLYDGMLIDDELYALWAKFADGVGVVMISDSCHSGTVLRAARRNTGDAPAYENVRTRLLPLDIAGRTFRNNRDFYTRIGRMARGADERILTRELNMPLRCSVILMAGCQDNQQSQDGTFNGRFTQELLFVWDEGRFEGSWSDMMNRIVPNMPVNQTPRMMLIGQNPEVLAAQPPFSI